MSIFYRMSESNVKEVESGYIVNINNDTYYANNIEEIKKIILKNFKTKNNFDVQIINNINNLEANDFRVVNDTFNKATGAREIFYETIIKNNNIKVIKNFNVVYSNCNDNMYHINYHSWEYNNASIFAYLCITIQYKIDLITSFANYIKVCEILNSTEYNNINYSSNLSANDDFVIETDNLGLVSNKENLISNITTVMRTSYDVYDHSINFNIKNISNNAIVNGNLIEYYADDNIFTFSIEIGTTGKEHDSKGNDINYYMTYNIIPQGKYHNYFNIYVRCAKVMKIEEIFSKYIEICKLYHE